MKSQDWEGHSMEIVKIFYKWECLKANSVSENLFESTPLYEDDTVVLINIGNYPVIFIKREIDITKHKIKKGAIEVDFHRRLNLLDESRIYTGISITFANQESQSVKAFLGTIWLLLGNGDKFNETLDLPDTIENFVRIMDKKSNNIRDIIGLWGELFIICNQPEAYRKRFTDAWRSDSKNKFDFNFENCDLEIKTTLKSERIHHLSVEQLKPNGQRKLTYASLLLRKQENGTNLFDLIARIKPWLSREKFQSTLADFIGTTNTIDSDSNLITKFSESYALANLRYVKASEIPRPIIREEDLGFISDVEFSINLTQLILNPNNIEENPSSTKE